MDNALAVTHDHAHLPRPTPTALLTTPPPDRVATAVCVLALVAYGAGLVVLARRGDHWPTRRTISWASGIALVFSVTGTGVAAYAVPLFSVHMGQHMVLTMFAPILLVLGAPVTLALRALPAGRGPRSPRALLLRVLHSRALAELSSPPAALVLFVAGLWGLYFTDLFALLMSHHGGHLLMVAHFLMTGYLFFWLLIGVDPGPRRPPELVRLAMMLPVGAAHAFFSVTVAFSQTPIAGDYYAMVRPVWAGPVEADQALGGAVAGGLSEAPLLAVGAVLFLGWMRRSELRAEPRRRDLHPGLD